MKKHLYYFILSAVFAIISSNCFAQSQGPNKPDTVFNKIVPSARVWNNPLNAKDSDKIYATDSLGGLLTRSYYLEATGFNFSLPSNATITGITARVLGHDTTKSLLSIFNYVYLVKDTVIQHDSMSGIGLTNVDRWQTFGGCSNVWNNPTWTYSEINSPYFGMAYFVRAAFLLPTGYVKVSIDAVEMSVCYTVPSSEGILTQTSFAGSIYPNPSKGEVQLNYTGNYLLQIDDLAGKDLYHSNLQGPQNIDLSFLSAGIYFMHITSGSDTEVKKLVIEK